MTSRRLPGKVLKPLAGRPMLAHTLERLGRCRRADGLVVAASDDPADDPIADFLSAAKIPCFRGSLDDVAGRMAAAASAVGADSLVRICGDSPFIDPRIVDDAIATFMSDRCDLVTNVSPRTFPRGMSVEVIATSVLADIAGRDLTAAQREHVTTYFYDNPAEFGIVAVTRPDPLDAYGFVVDEPADFERAEQLIASIGAGYAAMGLEQLVRAYDQMIAPEN